jgi:hypothetical protein
MKIASRPLAPFTNEQLVPRLNIKLDSAAAEINRLMARLNEVCLENMKLRTAYTENLELHVAYGEAQRESLLLKGRLDRAERDMEALTLACRMAKATNDGRTDRECLRLAVRVAPVLPVGWSISIELMCDSGSIALVGPDGGVQYFDDMADGMSYALAEVIGAAGRCAGAANERT